MDADSVDRNRLAQLQQHGLTLAALGLTPFAEMTGRLSLRPACEEAVGASVLWGAVDLLVPQCSLAAGPQCANLQRSAAKLAHGNWT